MPTRVRLSVAVLCCLWPATGQDPAEWSRPGPNVALGAAYTLAPAPSYALCQDPDDTIQVTDGEYTAGYFWTQPSTVGWGAAHEPLITIDLGRPQAIAGLSYHTAAGRAGVFWPRSIALFVSDDGQRWHAVGDLVALDQKRGGAPPEEYATYRFWSGALHTHGRFVALAIQPQATYSFVDEIEIYGGDPAWLAQPLDGPVMDGLEAARLRRRAVADVEAQLEVLRQRLLAVAEDARPGLQAALDRVAAGLDQLQPPPPARAELPFGEAHLAVLAVNAAIGRALGRPPLVLWQSNKWDPIEMITAPPAVPAPPRLDYALLRGEIRGEVLNLTNFGPDVLRLTCRVAGLPADAVSLRQAVWTAVRDAPPMASALPLLNQPLVLEPGVNRQLWLAVDAARLPPGDLTGRLLVEGGPDGPGAVPLTVHVSRLALPAKPTLATGGWDYTNAPHRGVTADNVDQVVSFLRQYGVDAPWATSAALPFGRHDAAGAMLEPPSTANLDGWLDRWPDARYYCVFVATSENIAQQPGGERKVGEWIRFWTAHLARRVSTRASWSCCWWTKRARWSRTPSSWPGPRRSSGWPPRCGSSTTRSGKTPARRRSACTRPRTSSAPIGSAGSNNRPPTSRSSRRSRPPGGH